MSSSGLDTAVGTAVGAAEPARREADRALAARDAGIAALNWVLDDDLLSELLGERVLITRTRYKPQNSALVVFRHAGSGAFGWASTTTPEHAGKLQRRADSSQRHGGGMRLLKPARRSPDVVVAVGPIEDDWPLRPNLRWLRDHGLGRLGAVPVPPGSFPLSPQNVLRYNPERRLVIRMDSGNGALVVRTAVGPDDGGAGLRRRLAVRGVPVLPELADPDCAAHGISASPYWGDRDLSGGENDPAAFRAGEALAAIHGIDIGIRALPVEELQALERQLAATRSMVCRLQPELEEPVTRLTNLLVARTCSPGRQIGKPVLAHGDFSADQVLVAGPAVRIIDFDRSRIAEAAMDLGSFAAVEDIADHADDRSGAGGHKTARLIAGYREAGGHASAAGVDTWAAFRLFLGSVDPFRNRASDWPADTQWHVRRALELIA